MESKKLMLEENVRLKGLHGGLTTETTDIILKGSRNKGTELQMAAYLYAIVQANAKTAREVLGMKKEGYGKSGF
jgi:hypothetical protein